MVDRIQQIAALDLIKRINIMQHNIRFIGNELANIQNVPAGEELNRHLANFNGVNKMSSTGQLVMNKAVYRNCVSVGLSNYLTSANHCDDDFSTGKLVFSGISSIPGNLGAWRVLGNIILGYQFKMTVPTIRFPPALQSITVCHDLLDAMMYEMRGFNSHNGQSHGMDFESTRQLIRMRLRSLSRYLSRKSGYVEDYIVIEGLKGILLAGVETARNSLDLISLSHEIEIGIPRLILFRRHWSF